MNIFCCLFLGFGYLPSQPPYQNYVGTGTLTLLPDRIQAIVPAYRFTSAGRITQWGACFRRGASFHRYYVSYQVWREASPGCFYLVGSNSPQRVHVADLLRPEGNCNLTSVSSEDQVAVQAGDVVGFYSDHFEAVQGGLSDYDYDSGIQTLFTGGYITDIYYDRGLSRSGLSTSYAAGTSAALCSGALLAAGFDGSQLSRTLRGAPVITAVIGQ